MTRRLPQQQLTPISPQQAKRLHYTKHSFPFAATTTLSHWPLTSTTATPSIIEKQQVITIINLEREKEQQVITTIDSYKRFLFSSHSTIIKERRAINFSSVIPFSQSSPINKIVARRFNQQHRLPSTRQPPRFLTSWTSALNGYLQRHLFRPSISHKR